MAITLSQGLRPEHYPDAARLYWQAFGPKLEKLMGPKARGTGFFEAGINPDAVISALEGVQLMGIAAFKTGTDGFSKGGAFWRHYGIGTLWRLPLLAMLERKAPEDT